MMSTCCAVVVAFVFYRSVFDRKCDANAFGYLLFLSYVISFDHSA